MQPKERREENGFEIARHKGHDRIFSYSGPGGDIEIPFGVEEFDTQQIFQGSTVDAMHFTCRKLMFPPKRLFPWASVVDGCENMEKLILSIEEGDIRINGNILRKYFPNLKEIVVLGNEQTRVQMTAYMYDNLNITGKFGMLFNTYSNRHAFIYSPYLMPAKCNDKWALLLSFLEHPEVYGELAQDYKKWVVRTQSTLLKLRPGDDRWEKVVRKILEADIQLREATYDYILTVLEGRGNVDLITQVMQTKNRYYNNPNAIARKEQQTLKDLANPGRIHAVKENWKYTQIPGGIKLNSYKKEFNGMAVAVPDTVGSKPVITVGDSFLNHNQRNNVNLIFPDSIKVLPGHAFQTCKINHLVLPESLYKIPKYCFYLSEFRYGFTIPSGVRIISEYAFAHCAGDISIHREVEMIGDLAFCDTSVTEVDVAGDYVGHQAFKDSQLTYARIRGKALLEDAMNGAARLKRLSLPNAIFVAPSALTGCVNLTDIYLGAEDVEGIDVAASQIRGGNRPWKIRVHVRPCIWREYEWRFHERFMEVVDDYEQTEKEWNNADV